MAKVESKNPSLLTFLTYNQIGDLIRCVQQHAGQGYQSASDGDLGALLAGAAGIPEGLRYTPPLDDDYDRLFSVAAEYFDELREAEARFIRQLYGHKG